jgi:hypothetical protein
MLLYNFAELTQQQKDALQALVNKYKDVEGSYESTMLGGIVHGYCDSGILTDSYSVEDAELVNKYFTDEAQCSGYLELFNNFIVEASGGTEELLCCKVIEEMCAIADCELAAAYIGKLTDSLMEDCYTD